MYENVLQWSANPFFVGGVFIISLIGFHILFVLVRPLTLAGWRLMDYIWITLALASVAGFVEDAQHSRASIQQSEARIELEDSHRRFGHWLEVYTEFTCETDPVSDSCRWFESASRDFEFISANEPFPARLPSSLLQGLEALDLEKADQAIGRRHLDRYQTTQQAFLLFLEQGGQSAFAVFLTAFAPLILAIAAALRFTKVTGEYLLVRAN